MNVAWACHFSGHRALASWHATTSDSNRGNTACGSPRSVTSTAPTTLAANTPGVGSRGSCSPWRRCADLVNPKRRAIANFVSDPSVMARSYAAANGEVQIEQFSPGLPGNPRLGISHAVGGRHEG